MFTRSKNLNVVKMLACDNSSVLSIATVKNSMRNLMIVLECFALPVKDSS